jgi:catechol 2,3-dioxygenase-like lactoylglutathione lyase family enzyme
VGAYRISAVVCSGDLARSQEFYEQVMGLTLSVERIPNHLLFECRGGTLLVYGRPAPNAADHTQVRLWSDDVERDVREFASRGAGDTGLEPVTLLVDQALDEHIEDGRFPLTKSPRSRARTCPEPCPRLCRSSLTQPPPTTPYLALPSQIRPPDDNF